MTFDKYTLEGLYPILECFPQYKCVRLFLDVLEKPYENNCVYKSLIKEFKCEEYAPYSGPTWFYIIFDTNGDPIAISREYVSGSRVCGTMSTPVENIDTMTLS